MTKKAKKPKHLSTGSTLLNLAISGSVDGGFPVGKYTFFVGDSSSGKTFFCLTCLAEAAKVKFFDKHRFIYDDVENGALMNREEFFGKAVAARLEDPSEEGPSYTVQDFYFNLDDAIQRAQNGEPFIYILDSMDGLTSESELDKFEETKKATRAGKEVAGSYGDGKAKANSGNLRKVMRPLADTDSILIIINQTRDNIGGMTFDKKTRSGGRSLKFYAAIELWSSIVGEIKKTVRGKQRSLGVFSKVAVKKNRVAGRNRSVVVPIFTSYGMDDIRGCIDFLVEEKHWKGNKTTVTAPEFDFKGKITGLIAKIEEENLEQDLQGITEEVWIAIENACKQQRKKRYA